MRKFVLLVCVFLSSYAMFSTTASGATPNARLSGIFALDVPFYQGDCISGIPGCSESQFNWAGKSLVFNTGIFAWRSPGDILGCQKFSDFGLPPCAGVRVGGQGYNAELSALRFDIDLITFRTQDEESVIPDLGFLFPSPIGLFLTRNTENGGYYALSNGFHKLGSGSYFGKAGCASCEPSRWILQDVRLYVSGSVPELATWTQMLIGFGAVGFVSRGRRKYRAVTPTNGRNGILNLLSICSFGQRRT